MAPKMPRQLGITRLCCVSFRQNTNIRILDFPAVNVKSSWALIYLWKAARIKISQGSYSSPGCCSSRVCSITFSTSGWMRTMYILLKTAQSTRSALRKALKVDLLSRTRCCTWYSLMLLRVWARCLARQSGHRRFRWIAAAPARSLSQINPFVF